MSRGPGRIERALKEIFESNANKRLSLPALATMVHSENYTLAQYKSVCRAAKKVAKTLGWDYSCRKYFRPDGKTLHDHYAEFFPEMLAKQQAKS